MGINVENAKNSSFQDMENGTMKGTKNKDLFRFQIQRVISHLDLQVSNINPQIYRWYKGTNLVKLRRTIDEIEY